MDHYKLKINFLISNNASANLTQNTPKPKSKVKKCYGCNQRRKIFDETQQICSSCHITKSVTSSGNKVIDDFIRFTLTNRAKEYGRMKFVPHDRFKDLKFIAEGGFSKVYKATWINSPIFNWNVKRQRYDRRDDMMVVLKKLNNSKNIKSKDLNEVQYSIPILIINLNMRQIT